MSYDTTGPVKVNETKSLMLLILLVGLVAGGVWVALAVNKPPPAANANSGGPPATVSAAPTVAITPPPPVRPIVKPRRKTTFGPDRSPDGITHPSGNVTLIKTGSIYITISVNDTAGKKDITISRSRPRDEKGEFWAWASMIQWITSDPKVAEKYNLTSEQVTALKELKIRTPQLSGDQRKELTDLFNALESAKIEVRPAAEKALLQAAAGMPIPADEQKAFEAAIAKARAILRPEQIDSIESSF